VRLKCTRYWMYSQVPRTCLSAAVEPAETTSKLHPYLTVFATPYQSTLHQPSREPLLDLATVANGPRNAVFVVVGELVCKKGRVSPAPVSPLALTPPVCERGSIHSQCAFSCLRCRNRRSFCSKEKPKCSRCREGAFECVYEEARRVAINESCVCICPARRLAQSSFSHQSTGISESCKPRSRLTKVPFYFLLIPRPVPRLISVIRTARPNPKHRLGQSTGTSNPRRCQGGGIRRRS